MSQTSCINCIGAGQSSMTDKERDAIYDDVARLAALRQELADLAAAAIARMEGEDEIDRSMEIRAAIMKAVDRQRILEGTVAMCEVMYLVLEQIENESILGFIAANGSREMPDDELHS